MWSRIASYFFTSGDLDFYWREQIFAFHWLPQIFWQNSGFGTSVIQSLWLSYPFVVVVKVFSTIGCSWWMIEKLFWIAIFALGIYSSYRLAKYVLNNSSWSLLAPVIYTSNTYVLLLFSGGQLGMMMAYSLSPLVLLKFIEHIDRYDDLRCTIYDLRRIISNGLLFALLVCFDLRVAYLVMGAIVWYFVFSILHLVCNHTFSKRYTLYQILTIIVIPLFITTVIHLFWILPIMFVRTGVSLVGEDFTNPGMIKFLSVADFSHAISFLHPNWPENLFGKVYFLQSEFLVLPIIAFSSLLFLNKTNGTDKTNRTNILFIALFSLLGAFLSKGANPPFGGIFIWLFNTVPGFVMFRDPTKFYLYIAIGYSILIPYTLSQLKNVAFRVSSLEKLFNRNSVSVLCCLLFLGFWLFTIRAVFTGQVTGNFTPLRLTSDYILFKNMLVADTTPYRTLWIPKTDKFVFSSDTHPALTADTLWKNASTGALLRIIEQPEFIKTIENAGVRYIIVPQDPEKRIFLSDYTFDETQRSSLVETVTKTGLRQLPEFQEFTVFENPRYVFQSSVPVYVKEQEYWSRVGLGIAGSVLIFVICLWVYDRKIRIK